MKKTRFTLIVLCLFMSTIQAQVSRRSCGATDCLNQMLQDNPSIAITRQEIEDQTQTYVAARTASASRSSSSIISIPVVVHVVYNTAVQNITDAQIQSQIDVLNEDYSQTNADWSGTPSVFQSVSGSPGVQFCLAQRDPSGNTTTGIIRKSTALTSFTITNAVKYTAQGGDDAWPAASYLNLWVCNLGSGLLGYAQFPGGATATDGVVINYTAFGNIGTVSAPYDKGRTATHEIGHWLNLYHIWGDDNGACTGTDHVDDTPNQAGENFGCPLFPHLSCTNGPNGDMFMNFMDYTDDPCMFMFSAGQCTRIQSLFAAGGARASILNSQGCAAPGGSTTACTTPSTLTSGQVSSPSDTIKWAAVSGATSYVMEYKPSTSSVWASTTATGSFKNLTGLTPGTTYDYQVEAVCHTSSSSYSTVKSFTTAAVSVCTDTYEPNETRSAAKDIPVNTDISAMINTMSDRDYFKFNNSSSQPHIKVTLTNLPADYDLKLYSADGTLISTSQNNGNAAECLQYNNAPVGAYYIAVYGNNNAYNATDCYTLKASLAATAWADENQTTGVTDMKAEIQYNVYPNPNNGRFHLMISTSELLSKVTVKVMDMIGNTIHLDEYENMEGLYTYEINLQGVAPGVYNVVITDGQSTETRKITVQK